MLAINRTLQIGKVQLANSDFLTGFLLELYIMIYSCVIILRHGSKLMMGYLRWVFAGIEPSELCFDFTLLVSI